jgi:probable rRNA maturation factor
MAKPVNFFVEDIDFKLTQSRKVSLWLQLVAASHSATIEEVNYIFVSDEYLLRLNQDFLQHDTFTDIITFPHDGSVPSKPSGDIYISVERIRENAAEFNVTFQQELHRVMAHGLLHLIGFEDKNPRAKKAMRAAEDAALLLLDN